MAWRACRPSASQTDFCRLAAAAARLTAGGPPIKMAPIAVLTYCTRRTSSHERPQLLIFQLLKTISKQ